MFSHSRPYSGLLRERIQVNAKTTPDDIAAAEFARLEALFDHYGLDIGEGHDRYRLIMALARRHVPGFKWSQSRSPATTQQKKGGRPPAIDHLMRLKLQWLVSELRRQINPATGTRYRKTEAIFTAAHQLGLDHIKPSTILRNFYRDRKHAYPTKAIVDEFLGRVAGDRVSNTAAKPYGQIQGAFGIYSQNRPKNRVRKPKR